MRNLTKSNRHKVVLLLLPLLALMMVACNPAGTYEGEKGKIIISENKTWTHEIPMVDAFGERYTKRNIGKLEGYTLYKTNNVYASKIMYGYLSGRIIHIDDDTFKKR